MVFFQSALVHGLFSLKYKMAVAPATADINCLGVIMFLYRADEPLFDPEVKSCPTCKHFRHPSQYEDNDDYQCWTCDEFYSNWEEY